MSNNFIIHKTIFANTRFDESLSNYGHEDTLFGFELVKKGININHIDNPILNGYIESNTSFIRKTEEAIINLAYIIKKLDYDEDLINEIKLLKVYFQITRKGLSPLINIIFPLIKPPIKGLLHHGIINLYLFDIYKLATISKALKTGS